MTSFARRVTSRAFLLGLVAACSSSVDLTPQSGLGSAERGARSSRGAAGAAGTSAAASPGRGGTEVTPLDPPLDPPPPSIGNAPGVAMPDAGTSSAACPDDDGDGRCNADDSCPAIADDGTDDDADGKPNACDRCPLVPNQDDTADADNDRRPDACDTCDGVASTLAMGPLYYFSFDEPAGATEVTSRGSVPFSAALVGGAQLGIAGVADGAGTAIHLAANAAFPRVQAINIPQQFPSTAITVTAWVRTRQPGLYTILSYAVPESFNEFGVYINGSGTRIGIESLNFDQEMRANRITDGSWHFLAVTWANDTLQIYFDGEPGGPALQTSLAAANQSLFPSDPGETIDISPGGTLIFGQDQDTLNGGFAIEQGLNGGLDEVAIFDRALSADEIRQVFTATTCGERCDRIDNDGDGLVDEGFLGSLPTCPAASCQAIQESGAAFVGGGYFLQSDPNREVSCTFQALSPGTPP